MGVRWRKTPALIAVLGVLLEGECFGREVVSRTGLAGGTVYPLLSRLEGEGLVLSWWEGEGRGPRRRFYRLTGSGVVFARSVTGFAAIE